MRNQTITFTTFFAILLMVVGSANAQQIRVYSDLVEEHSVQPGETVTNTIYVENRTSEEQRVHIDMENYLYGLDRSEQNVDHDRSAISMITFSPSELRIGPNSREGVTYRMTVPNDASGSYWAMMTIQPISMGDRLYASKDSTVQIRQKVRWGINIVGTAPGGQPNIQSLGSEIQGDKLLVSMENTGTVSIRPHTSLKLYDENGNELETVEGQQILMHPTTSVRAGFDVSDVPSGSYSGVVMIESEQGVYGIRVNLSL